MDFLVSVIVPVYNGEAFIKKAITSICQQPEVHEIIVINDGSKDKTQEILDKLRLEYPIIKVFFHENKSNKGRSASRNLGIRKITGNFIAFLDADDYYLNNRFKNDKKIFVENYECDGVYNAIGAHFYRKASKNEQVILELTTMTRKIEPDNLFEVLLSGDYGHFSIDGLTVKKKVFEKAGIFNEQLMVSEDTELIYKMALKCKLLTGIIDQPVAIRGVHEKNVTGNVDLYKFYEQKMYKSLFFWSSKQKLDLKVTERFLERIWITRYEEGNNLFKDIYYWVYLVINSPKTIISNLTLKYFPLVRKRKKLFSIFYSK